MNLIHTISSPADPAGLSWNARSCTQLLRQEFESIDFGHTATEIRVQQMLLDSAAADDPVCSCCGNIQVQQMLLDSAEPLDPVRSCCDRGASLLISCTLQQKFESSRCCWTRLQLTILYAATVASVRHKSTVPLVVFHEDRHGPRWHSDRSFLGNRLLAIRLRRHVASIRIVVRWFFLSSVLFCVKFPFLDKTFGFGPCSCGAR
jgi:hypothetical protein